MTIGSELSRKSWVPVRKRALSGPARTLLATANRNPKVLQETGA